MMLYDCISIITSDYLTGLNKAYDRWKIGVQGVEDFYNYDHPPNVCLEQLLSVELYTCTLLQFLVKTFLQIKKFILADNGYMYWNVEHYCVNWGKMANNRVNRLLKNKPSKFLLRNKEHFRFLENSIDIHEQKSICISKIAQWYFF